MIENLTATVTGSTGKSLQDAGVRGTIAAALTAVLVYLADKTTYLETEDVGALAPLVILASFLLAGIYDHFFRKPPASPSA